MSNTTQYTRSNAPRTIGLIGLVILAIVAALVLASNGGLPAKATASEPTSTSTPEATVSKENCEPQFIQVASNNKNNRVIGDFETRYAAATAHAANLSDAQRTLLVEEAGKNAQTLAVWAHAFGLYENPDSWPSLIDDNCLSSEGQRLHAQFEGALNATGTTFEESEAPANGYNSGINDGAYVVASSRGINGDRKAIMVTLKDGTVVYIMIRCGNPVFDNPPPDIPPGDTDEPPPPKKEMCPTNPALPIDHPNCKEKKEPGKDPWPKKKAPRGGGENEDRGPGEYQPPEDVPKPPSTPRPNPTTPAPKPPSTGPKPSPDPAPAPSPEPEAPKPSDPETGCDDSVPGVTC